MSELRIPTVCYVEKIFSNERLKPIMQRAIISRTRLCATDGFSLVSLFIPNIPKEFHYKLISAEMIKKARSLAKKNKVDNKYMKFECKNGKEVYLEDGTSFPFPLISVNRKQTIQEVKKLAKEAVPSVIVNAVKNKYVGHKIGFNSGIMKDVLDAFGCGECVVMDIRSFLKPIIIKTEENTIPDFVVDKVDNDKATEITVDAYKKWIALLMPRKVAKLEAKLKNRT